MYEGEGQVVVKPAITVAVSIAVVVTLLLGLFPDPWLELTRDAVFSTVQALASG